ncbi:MAG: Holliday junction resolvase RuvX [Kiloniellales bacterium]|nr:Holliday junction resolvase RuvX [Kiloniellales bacterium]
MSIFSLEAFAAALPRRGRLLGVDLGSKTLGLAISDGARRVASPLETLVRGKFTADAKSLAGLCAEREVAGIVIGLPVNMDGSEGPRCQSTRQFATNLVEQAGLDLPIAFWDERLSTAAVERLLVSEADMSRRRRGEVVDKLAAAYILQGALDALARQAGAGPAA